MKTICALLVVVCLAGVARSDTNFNSLALAGSASGALLNQAGGAYGSLYGSPLLSSLGIAGGYPGFGGINRGVINPLYAAGFNPKLYGYGSKSPYTYRGIPGSYNVHNVYPSKKYSGKYYPSGGYPLAGNFPGALGGVGLYPGIAAPASYGKNYGFKQGSIKYGYPSFAPVQQIRYNFGYPSYGKVNKLRGY